MMDEKHGPYVRIVASGSVFLCDVEAALAQQFRGFARAEIEPGFVEACAEREVRAWRTRSSKMFRLRPAA
ncbi:MAG: hypothetical protein JNL06_18395 [Alphaproteobacteria bacterium]|nr:hypothetical protein [Alphaproteobacteria bacterium]